MELGPGWVMAPDGIPVRPIPLPEGSLIGLAEGRIAPGDYGVHFHYSLEQATYLVSGRLTVRMGEPDEEHSLEIGQAVLTEPGRTLSFHNYGPDDATVLFVCTPPYPPNDADTGRPNQHGPLGESDRQLARERQGEALVHIARLFAARSARSGDDA